MSSATAARPRARALLIGVGATDWIPPGGERLARLPGVANDLRAMRRMLTSRGFEIIDKGRARLTAKRVSDLLVDAVDLTGPGDLLVLYLSGHGYQLRDDGKDELPERDGRLPFDECYVCLDKPLRDDWFRNVLWKRARPGSQLVAVIDACHSETALLGIDRPPPPEPVPVARLPERPFSRLVLSACRDGELAVEAETGDRLGVRAGGLVTDNMLQVLDDRPGVTYKELWELVPGMIRREDPIGRAGTPVSSYSSRDVVLLNSPAFTPPSPPITG